MSNPDATSSAEDLFLALFGYVPVSPLGAADWRLISTISAALAVAVMDERMACLKIARSHVGACPGWHETGGDLADCIADAIAARGIRDEAGGTG